MKYLITIILSISSFIAIAQTPGYETRKIANWTVQYFPAQYLVKPHHVSVIKNKYGKLAYYQEMDAYGRPNGITVEMQDNYIYPYTITYYCKGSMVYSSSFFPNSNKAESIANRNLKNELDGPQITRTFKEDNSITENKTIFKNGKDVREKERKALQIPYNSEGLLNGSFTIENNPFGYPDLYRIYKVRANNGYIEYFEARQKDSSFVSYETNGYCVTYTQSVKDGKYLTYGRLKERFRIINPAVTTSGNNDFLQISWDKSDISDEMTWVEQKLGPTKTSDEEREHFEFTGNFLANEFSSEVFCNAIITGFSKNGVIQEALISYVDGYYKKIIKHGNKYTIQKLDQNKNILKTVEFEITHPVLLVNDDKVNNQNSTTTEMYMVKKGFNIWDPIFKMIGHSDEIKAL